MVRGRPRRFGGRVRGGEPLERRTRDCFRTDAQARTLIGLGSGESVQMELKGDGWVLVQPSEGGPAGGGSRSRGDGGLLDLILGA